MRKVIHSAAITVAALIGAVALAIGSAMSSAVSLAATAFIVPGTGTPNANVVGGYMEQALDRYIAPFSSSCTSQADCDLEGIDYFASFWPFSFISGWCVPGRCEKWDVSVEDGRANLHTALEPYLGTDEEIVIFGYSQGAAVTSNEMRYLSANYAPDQFDNFSVVNIGSIDNRVGGAWTVLGFLDYIPILDVTTNLYNPISTGMPMTTINFQYDPVGSLPLYFNLLAVANALIALDNVHGLYLAPNEGDPDGTLPYGYTDETLAEQLNCAGNNNCKKDEFGNVYVTIPARGLPLTNAVRDFVDSIGLGWLVDPFIDLVEPALQVMIDTAYDPEADPGDVRYLSLLPFNPNTNLLEFGNDLFRASVAGVEAFFDAVFDPSSSADTQETEPAAMAAQVGETTTSTVASGSTSESDSEAGTPSEVVDSEQPEAVPAEPVDTDASAETAEATDEAVEDADLSAELVMLDEVKEAAAETIDEAAVDEAIDEAIDGAAMDAIEDDFETAPDDAAQGESTDETDSINGDANATEADATADSNESATGSADSATGSDVDQQAA